MSATGASRIGAFLLAWRWVLVLALLLCASLYLNYRQHMSALTVPLRTELDAARQGLALSGVLHSDARAAGDALRLEVDRARETLAGAGREYRRAARTTPLPATCAPGAARMEAVNAMLGEPRER